MRLLVPFAVLAVALFACSDDDPPGSGQSLSLGAAGTGGVGGSSGGAVGISGTGGTNTGGAAGEPPPERFCAPNVQVYCKCGTDDGYQTCTATGDGYSECFCGDAAGSGGSAGGSAVGGSGGAGATTAEGGAAGSAGVGYPEGCHAPCEVGERMHTTCSAQIAVICAAHPYCCDPKYKWDHTCVSEYKLTGPDKCQQP